MEVVRIDSSTSDDNHLLVSNYTSTYTVCKACFSVILILINFSGKTRFEGLPGGENRFVIHFVVFTVHSNLPNLKTKRSCPSSSPPVHGESRQHQKRAAAADEPLLGTGNYYQHFRLGLNDHSHRCKIQ